MVCLPALKLSISELLLLKAEEMRGGDKCCFVLKSGFNHLEHLDIDRWLLKYILNKIQGPGLDSSATRYRPMVGSHEYSNEPSGSMRGNFSTRWMIITFSNTLLHRDSYTTVELSVHGLKVW